MKLGLIHLIFIFTSTPVYTQRKGELNTSFLYGYIISNKLGGTPKNYEDYGPYSGVNLKCTSNNGFQLSYQRSFTNSKWFFRGDFERRWLTYKTTLYSGQYDPETEFNKIKKIEVNSQYSTFKLGAGRRFSFFDSKLNFDISFDMTYQIYDKNKVGYLDSIDHFKVSKLELGDFNYQVELDYTDYNGKLNFSVQSSIKYFPIKNIGLNFYTSWTNSITGYYDFETLTRGPVVVVGNTAYGQLYWGNGNYLGRIITRYLTFGLGISYRFGD